MKALSILLLASVCAFGQEPCTGGGPDHKNPPDCVPAAQYFTQHPTGTLPTPKPLKCGKYEQLVSVYSQTTGFKLRDECVPIMHEVTEKEWQALMERLKKMERTALICKEVGKDSVCETVEYKERAGKE